MDVSLRQHLNLQVPLCQGTPRESRSVVIQGRVIGQPGFRALEAVGMGSNARAAVMKAVIFQDLARAAGISVPVAAVIKHQ